MATQQNYVEKILVIFGMNNVKHVQIPFALNFKISSGLYPSNDEQKVVYVSCTMW